VEREWLERRLADVFERSPTTIRHWLGRHRLTSEPTRRRMLVEEAGGRCVLCGYSRFHAALQFHHVDPAAKSFALSREGVTRSLARARAEAQKCVLLCANCHAEVEGGFVELPLRSGHGSSYPA
jgi:hypothetical protein